MDNRQGVRLIRYVDKSTALHLTATEHRAIHRARARHRSGPARVEVQTGSGRRLDLALAVVRHLEEQGTGWASGQALAEDLDVPATTLLDALEALLEDVSQGRNRGRPIVDDLEVEHRYDMTTGGVVDFRVRIRDALSSRHGAGSVSPTFGRGMHHVGRFAYTPAETDERLELIARALQDAGTSATDVPLLIRSRDKLGQWHGVLTGREWTPGDCCRPGTPRSRADVS
ncbi:hypothetical protein ACI8AK_02490 [Geodermatophilus sp. SYSU D00867]